MGKNVLFRKSAFDEEVSYCLERQMIPAWERYGMSHLVVSAKSVADFLTLPQPDQVEARAHKTARRSAIKNRRRAGRQAIIESWPEEDLVNIRFPMLVYVRSGQALLHIGNYIVACPQGHFLFLAPGVQGGQQHQKACSAALQTLLLAGHVINEGSNFLRPIDGIRFAL